MSEQPPKLVRIFISSPRDVAEERKAAAELIEQELAKREAFRKPLKLDVFRYDDPDSDTPFQANRSAQASVDQRLQSADAEIVVAILWARMGTPVRDPKDPATILYESGTEQEIEEALTAGREVLVYFRRGQPSAPDDDDELDEFKEQRQKVRVLRKRVEDGGRGVNEYQDVEDFRRRLAQHLDQFLTRIRDTSLAPDRQMMTAPEPSWSGDPYPGLRSFEPEEAPIFFGRSDETAELVRWVVEEGRPWSASRAAASPHWLRRGWDRSSRSGRARSCGSPTLAATRSARSPSGSNRCCHHHAERRFEAIRRRGSWSPVGSRRFSPRSRQAAAC